MEHSAKTIFEQRQKAHEAVRVSKQLIRELAKTSNLSKAMALAAKTQATLKGLYWIEGNMRYYSPCHLLSKKEARFAQTWWRTLRSIARAHNRLVIAMEKAKAGADCYNQFGESFLSRYVPRLIAL